MVSAINYPDGEDSQESQVPLDEETQLEEGTERLPDLEDRDSSSDEEEADPSSTHRPMARKKNKKERSNSTTAHPAHLTFAADEDDDDPDDDDEDVLLCLPVGSCQRVGIIGGEGVKRLVIIADNCPGQNKNNCVFKFCCWLVEAGWAKEVVMMFLIKGHTKNECDSKFNSLKKGRDGRI